MITAILAEHRASCMSGLVSGFVTAVLSVFAVLEEMERESVLRRRSGDLDFAAEMSLWAYEDMARRILCGGEGETHPEYVAYKEREKALQKNRVLGEHATEGLTEPRSGLVGDRNPQRAFESKHAVLFGQGSNLPETSSSYATTADESKTEIT